MKKLKIIIATVILIVFGCNKKQSGNNENSENNKNDEIVINNDSIQQSNDESANNSDEIKENFKFEFTNIINHHFIACGETATSFLIEFELKNNSNIPINTFYFNSAVEGVFSDGEKIKQDGTFDHYSNIISINKIWKPNEIRTFKIYLPNVPYNYNFFRKDYFERTPENIGITFNFIARGVDGEFEETRGFNLLEEWKEYQTELGYR